MYAINQLVALIQLIYSISTLEQHPLKAEIQVIMKLPRGSVVLQRCSMQQFAMFCYYKDKPRSLQCK